MKSRFAAVTATLIALTAPQAIAAQASMEVTLNVPVDLTQLSPELLRIKVGCTIVSRAITTPGANGQMTVSQDVAVTNGRVQRTVQLVFQLTGLDKPDENPATTVCALNAYDEVNRTLEQLKPGHPNPIFRTNVTVGLVDGPRAW